MYVGLSGIILDFSCYLRILSGLTFVSDVSFYTEVPYKHALTLYASFLSARSHLAVCEVSVL